jgi:hypothetical protein
MVHQTYHPRTKISLQIKRNKESLQAVIKNGTGDTRWLFSSHKAKTLLKHFPHKAKEAVISSSTGDTRWLLLSQSQNSTQTVFTLSKTISEFEQYQRNKMASRATNSRIITAWLFSRSLLSAKDHN